LPSAGVLVLLSAEALELALGVGAGVVAEAMPATPIPAPRASAVAVRPRVILFVRDIFFVSWICRTVTAAHGVSPVSRHNPASSGWFWISCSEPFIFL
jgi:hypothetical protein